MMRKGRNGSPRQTRPDVHSNTIRDHLHSGAMAVGYRSYRRDRRHNLRLAAITRGEEMSNELMLAWIIGVSVMFLGAVIIALALF